MALPSEKRTKSQQTLREVYPNRDCSRKAKYYRPKKHHTNRTREDSKDNKLQSREDNRLLSDFLVSALVRTKAVIVIPSAAYLYPSERSYWAPRNYNPRITEMTRNDTSYLKLYLYLATCSKINPTCSLYIFFTFVIKHSQY